MAKQKHLTLKERLFCISNLLDNNYFFKAIGNIFGKYRTIITKKIRNLCFPFSYKCLNREQAQDKEQI